MNGKILTLSIFSIVIGNHVPAQNFIDKYLTEPLTYVTVGTSANNVSQPRDLDFRPNSRELWVLNKGTSAGGSVVIFYNAGVAGQTSQFRKDSHSGHFMMYPSALAFSDIGEWTTVQEIQNTSTPTSTFMGPSLWSADTAIFARVFQSNWASGYPLGSHLDMLHQSPFAMGIAHDSARAYWVLDGHNGNICKYDYVNHHGPGYDDHSSGRIWRYTDVSFTRVSNIPSHAVLDKATGWLYYVDGGPKIIKRMHTGSGTFTGNLTVPSTSIEPLASYSRMEFATVEHIDTLSTQPCGIDIYDNRLLVGDYNTGDIHVYNISGGFPVKLGMIPTGQPGMMGIKVGPDGKIWFVNYSANTVVRIDPLPAGADASIAGISAPLISNQTPNYYSTRFNWCESALAPSVILRNEGSNSLSSANINYVVDGGTVNTFIWTGSLAPGASETVNLPAAAVSSGSQKILVYTSSPNGNPDENPANDAKEGSFRVFNPMAPYPFSESFTSPTFPPPGWAYVNYNPNNKMSRIAIIGAFGGSPGCVRMDNYSGQVNISGQVDYLMTPRIDMSTAPSTAMLEFAVANAQYDNSTNDKLEVSISTDCGTSWTTLYSKAGDDLSTAPNVTSSFTPSASQWRGEKVSLASYAGQPEILLMFATTSAWGNNLYIDDINLISSLSVVENKINGLHVYPNPSSGRVFIDASDGTGITVLNLQGQAVMQLPVSGPGSYELDLSALSNGTYFLKLTAENESIVRKIIIAK